MKRLIHTILLIVALLPLASSCSDTAGVWADLPLQISEFMSRYFPEEGVSKFVDDGTAYYVNVKNGPEVIFNDQYDWISINGNGETLPPVFLFDELPPALYSWLQENECVDGVYKAMRDATEYELTLGDIIVRYDINTGIITQPYE